MKKIETMQDLFETVAKHLLTQGHRAEESGAVLHGKVLETPQCKYRTGEASCAVGCLISDEAYRAELEGLHVRRIEVRNALMLSGVSPTLLEETGLMMLADLQGCHDCYPPSDWRRRLIAIGVEFELNTAFISAETQS